MQIKITTDYIIRILVCLATQPYGAILSKKTICDVMGIPHAYFQKLIPLLVNKGYITALMGSSGGYRLIKPSEEISLWDIVTSCEGTMKINRCLEPDKKCSRGAAGYCQMHIVLQGIQDLLEGAFKDKTIADLADMSLFEIGRGTMPELTVPQTRY